MEEEEEGDVCHTQDARGRRKKIADIPEQSLVKKNIFQVSKDEEWKYFPSLIPE